MRTCNLWCGCCPLVCARAVCLRAFSAQCLVRECIEIVFMPLCNVLVPSYVLICPMQCDLCMPLAMSLYEIEIENTLACLSGAQMGSNHEKKTGGRTSRDTLPLTKPTGPLLGMASISQRYSYRKFEIFFIQLYHWHRTAWLSSIQKCSAWINAVQNNYKLLIL